MPNPIQVDCPKNTWTKVATAVKSGLISLLTSSPRGYLQMWKESGDPAPTLKSEGVVIIGKSVPIQSTTSIDVYIYPVGAAGRVRVDL